MKLEINSLYTKQYVEPEYVSCNEKIIEEKILISKIQEKAQQSFRKPYKAENCSVHEGKGNINKENVK